MTELAVDATLPVVYSEARNALAKCARIDECKDWADRAAALASYAKQADDEQLLNNAKRIKARAIDRIGELAEEIPPHPGGRPSEITNGSVPTSYVQSRIQAARDAGLSKDQLVAALRVHNVPRDEFERQVESDNPPTITELARQGTKPRPIAPDLLDGRAVRLQASDASRPRGNAYDHTQLHAGEPAVPERTLTGDDMANALLEGAIRDIERLENKYNNIGLVRNALATARQTLAVHLVPAARKKGGGIHIVK